MAKIHKYSLEEAGNFPYFLFIIVNANLTSRREFGREATGYPNDLFSTVGCIGLLLSINSGLIDSFPALC